MDTITAGARPSDSCATPVKTKGGGNGKAAVDPCHAGAAGVSIACFAQHADTAGHAADTVYTCTARAGRRALSGLANHAGAIRCAAIAMYADTACADVDAHHRRACGASFGIYAVDGIPGYLQRAVDID